MYILAPSSSFLEVDAIALLELSSYESACGIGFALYNKEILL